MPENEKYAFTQNREISWLRFNERCLEEADKPEVSAYEKLKFISIFDSNLTEFFMVRVGSITDLALYSTGYSENKTGMTAQEQLFAVMKALRPMYEKKDILYKKVIEELKTYGVHYLDVSEFSEEQEVFTYKKFKEEFQSILSPQIVNVSHPFPFLENDTLYVVVEVKEKEKKTIGIVPIRPEFSPYVILPGDELYYTLTENVVLHYAEKLFPDAKIINKAVIKVTRNFDIADSTELRDEVDTYKDYMKGILKRRKRQQAVRLESNTLLSQNVLSFLTDSLDLDPLNYFVSSAPLKMKYVFQLLDDIPTSIKSKVLYPDFSPIYRYKDGIDGSLMKLVESQDLMLYYPYDDIKVFLDLIKEASNDPRVISIKITIYRLAKNSKLVQYLCNAAESGIEVTAFMELKARFDEQNNINYSDILYDSGANIIFGFEEYKIHSKLCLITYKDEDGIKHITQVGTGNYNESTSKQYTDFSLITSNKEFGMDAVDFFRNLATGSVNGHYEHLLQSPSTFKSRLMKLIEEEIEKGPEGKLLFKMNSLTDLDFIFKFSEASNAGVKVTLIIRGISCILPGVKGFTENVEIRSIVGRYLEHPRIYIFGSGDEKKYFISSADLMTRNTERRVEIAAPIYDKSIQKELDDYMDVQLRDNVKGRRMNSAGEYEMINDGKEPFIAQDYFMKESERFVKKEVEEKKEVEKIEEQKTIVEDVVQKEEKKGFLDKFLSFFK